MSTLNKASPTLGMAMGYFIVVAWAVPNEHLMVEHQTEAVAMAGVVVTNVIMELRAFLAWMGAFFARDTSK